MMNIAASGLNELLCRGIEFHQANRLLEAEACYKEVLAQDPNSADAVHLLGLLADAIGDKDLAVDLIKYAISLQPSNAVFHNNLANILKSKNELRLAIACYLEAIKLNPDYAEACFNLANLYRDLNRLEDAVPLYRQAVELDPEFAIAWINLAETLHKLGQLEESIHCHKKYLELKPDDIYCKTRLAEAYFEQGRKFEDNRQIDEAIASFEKALSVLPTHTQSRRKLDYFIFNRTTMLNEKTLKIGLSKFTLVSDDEYLQTMGEEFEPDMSLLFSLLVGKDDSVLDIGANIGCTSLLLGQLAKRVISFEPSPSTFKILELNILNSGLKNIEIHNVGLGMNKESLTLTHNPAMRSGGFVSNQTSVKSGHVTEKIVILNGDNELKNTPVNFIKIDTEDFELNVLKGLKDTISTYEPIVLAELNHWCLNAFQRTSVPEYFDYLSETFPYLYAINDQTYANLKDQDLRFHVMYEHILKLRFMNVVGAFDIKQLSRLLLNFKDISRT